MYKEDRFNPDRLCNKEVTYSACHEEGRSNDFVSFGSHTIH